MRRTEMGVQDMRNRRARSRGTDCRCFGTTPTGMDALDFTWELVYYLRRRRRVRVAGR